LSPPPPPHALYRHTGAHCTPLLLVDIGIEQPDTACLPAVSHAAHDAYLSYMYTSVRDTFAGEGVGTVYMLPSSVYLTSPAHVPTAFTEHFPVVHHAKYLLRGIYSYQKRLKLRLPGSARKSQKAVSRHAEVQISGRFRSDPAVSTLKRALRTRRPPSLNLRGVCIYIPRSRYALGMRVVMALDVFAYHADLVRHGEAWHK
jgi:hypothetical protein